MGRLQSCAERLGCLTRRDHPDDGVTLYSHDAAGNMTQETSTLDRLGRKEDTFFFMCLFVIRKFYVLIFRK